MKFIRAQVFENVAEEVLRQYLKLTFWLSWLIPFGAWKLYEILSEVL